MEQIADDPEGFEEEGGWSVLNTSINTKTDGDAKSEGENDDDDDDDDEDDGGDWIMGQVLYSLAFLTKKK